METRSTRGPRAWKIYSAACAVAMGVYFAGIGVAAQDVLFDIVAVSATVVIVARLSTRRPAEKRAWMALALGMTLWTVGDIIFNYLADVAHSDAYPTVADVLYLVGYPVLAYGLVRLLRVVHPQRGTGWFLESAVVAVAGGAVLWVTVLGPVIEHSTGSAVSRVVTIGYPALDLLLIVVAARFLTAGVGRAPWIYLILIGLAGVLASDAWVAHLNIDNAYRSGMLIDLGWLLGYAAWGIAALHPSSNRRYEPARIGTVLPSRPRLFALGGAALIIPSILVAKNSIVLTISSAVVLVLVFVRMAQLVKAGRERERVIVQRGDELAHAYSELDREHVARTNLLERSMEVADEERRRLAADLHDGPVQGLSAIAIEIELAKRAVERGDTARSAQLLTTLGARLGSQIGALRSTMTLLRSPVFDMTGLDRAIREQAERLERSSGVGCDVHIDPDTLLSSEAEEAVFRVTKEALTNIASHARARHVDVHLQRDGRIVRLEINDDGRGVGASSLERASREGHIGVPTMRERIRAAGGTFTISSPPGGGTCVRAELPASR